METTATTTTKRAPRKAIGRKRTANAPKLGRGGKAGRGKSKVGARKVGLNKRGAAKKT
jgi:hypothetical protein